MMMLQAALFQSSVIEDVQTLIGKNFCHSLEQSSDLCWFCQRITAIVVRSATIEIRLEQRWMSAWAQSQRRGLSIPQPDGRLIATYLLRRRVQGSF